MKQILFAAAVSAVVAASVVSLSADDESGFVPLFNGKDTAGWHLRKKDGHNSWTIDNGVLKNTVNKGEDASNRDHGESPLQPKTGGKRRSHGGARQLKVGQLPACPDLSTVSARTDVLIPPHCR